MKPKELAQKIKKKDAPCVIDVRSGIEFARGHIPGAIHVPFLTALLHLRKLPKEKGAPLIITCEHGPRAELAKLLLSLAGYRNLKLLEGHMSAWRRAGLPEEKKG